MSKQIATALSLSTAQLALTKWKRNRTLAMKKSPKVATYLPNKPRVIHPDITKLSREDWLKCRRSVNDGFTIGGSEASVVAGKNPWQTKLELYAGYWDFQLAYERQMNEDLLEAGHKYEREIAEKFCDMYGFILVEETQMFQNPRAPWQIANFDFLVMRQDGKICGLEIKWTPDQNYGFKKQVREGTAPIYYEYQMRQYMAISGIDEWYLALGTSEGNCTDAITNIEFMHLDRDLDIEQEMIEEQRLFIDNCKAKIAPTVTDTEDAELALESLIRVYGKGDKSLCSVQFGKAYKETLEKLMEYQKDQEYLKAELKIVDKKVTELSVLIIECLQKAKGGYLELGDGRKMIVENTSRSQARSYDEEKLKTEFPNVWNAVKIFTADKDLLRKVYPEVWDAIKKETCKAHVNVEIM